MLPHFTAFCDMHLLRAHADSGGLATQQLAFSIQGTSNLLVLRTTSTICDVHGHLDSFTEAAYRNTTSRLAPPATPPPHQTRTAPPTSPFKPVCCVCSTMQLLQVNTWILIARRVMPSRLLDILFYATWVMIRNIFFPYLIWDVSVEYIRAVHEAGTILHPIIFAPIMQIALTGLNYQWTFALMRKVLRPPSKDGGKSHLL